MEEVKKKIAVLRHADADGMGAAYAVWKALKDTCELLFISVQYGQAPPVAELAEFNPDKIFIVDFSYNAHTLNTLQIMYTKDITVIDHHKSALPELQAWLPEQSVNPGAGSYFFDLERSGCGLTWDLFHLDEEWVPEEHGSDTVQPSAPMPAILQYVQDRDLWKFELENSKEINAYIATMDDDFEQWDNFYLPEAYDCGRAILKFRAKQVESRLKDVRMMQFISLRDEVVKHYELAHPYQFVPFTDLTAPIKSVQVPFVNAAENISELGEAMCDAYPDAPFSVSYADRANGARSYSLRSNKGFDVSVVAKAFGGGGHKSAAGFTLRAPDII